MYSRITLLEVRPDDHCGPFQSAPRYDSVTAVSVPQSSRHPPGPAGRQTPAPPARPSAGRGLFLPPAGPSRLRAGGNHHGKPRALRNSPEGAPGSGRPLQASGRACARGRRRAPLPGSGPSADPGQARPGRPHGREGSDAVLPAPPYPYPPAPAEPWC